MRLYLSAQMEGKPKMAFPLFWRAALDLRGRGHDIYSPAENDVALGWVQVVSPDGDIMGPDPAQYPPPLEQYEIAVAEDLPVGEIMRRDMAEIDARDGIVLIDGTLANTGGKRAEIGRARRGGKKIFVWSPASRTGLRRLWLLKGARKG